MTDLGPLPSPGEIPAAFFNTMRFLSASFTNWSPSEGTVVAYYDALREFPPALVAEAARLYVREASAFAPTAGQLRKIALELRRKRQAHPDDCACFPCVNALPVGERWLRLSPAMRTMLEREQPEKAAALKAAVPPEVLERIASVRRLLGAPKSTIVALHDAKREVPGHRPLPGARLHVPAKVAAR